MYVFILGTTTPTDLNISQSGIVTVLVSWTAPSPPPSMGYQITINSTNFSAGIVASSATSHTIMELEPGVHSIRMRALSQQLPSEIVGPVNITVKGNSYAKFTIICPCIHAFITIF